MKTFVYVCTRCIKICEISIFIFTFPGVTQDCLNVSLQFEHKSTPFYKSHICDIFVSTTDQVFFSEFFWCIRQLGSLQDTTKRPCSDPHAHHIVPHLACATPLIVTCSQSQRARKHRCQCQTSKRADAERASCCSSGFVVQ